MVLWAVVAGALIGWAMADGSGFGLVFGGMIGAAMGRWLRSAIRQELALAIDRAPALRVAVSDEPAAPAVAAAEAPDFAPAPPEPATAVPPPAMAPIAQPAPAPAMARRDDGPATSQSEVQAQGPREPSPVEQLIGKARDWLLGGNTIVRVGLVILFVGLTFLARMAAYAGLFPIEARLALVALAGAALLAVGFNRRVQRPAFGLALQGAGVAVLYLTVFGAARVFGLMPPLAAFGLMIVFAVLGCALALLQNSRVLAFAAFLGGFAVPLLLGGESKSPVALFAYFTILNLALLAIAWRRSWRELNLLGFFATFGTATLWGLARYGPEHYLVCQIFLALSVAIYLFAAVFYAHNTPGKLGNAADTTLLFGPALAGFGLEVALVHDRAFGSAFGALAFGAGYLGVAAYTLRQRREDMRLLNECLLAIGVGFVTLAVPLALDAKWTSSAWALEGAGAFWVGARQARWMPRAFGLLLQAIAALILIGTLSANVSAIPFANNGFIGAALVAIPWLMTAWWMRRELPHSGSSWAKQYAEAEFALRHVMFLGGFVLAGIALIQEVTRQLPAATRDALPQGVFEPYQEVLLIMLALLGAAGLADWFGRRRSWAVASWPARLSLLLIALTFLETAAMGRHVQFGPDWLAWTLALGGHYALLHRSDRAELGKSVATWNYAMHAAGAWLLTAMLADCLSLAIDRGELWNTSWAGVIFLFSAATVLAVLTRWAGSRAAPLADTAGLAWPLHPAARAYWWVAAVPLAVLAYLGALTAALFAEGVTDPLPYVPLVNPVDLSVGLALAGLVSWRRMVGAAHEVPGAATALLGKPGLVAGGALAFAAINGIWLRTAHHWLGVDWSAEALGDSPVVQTGLAILWTLLAMGLMLTAHRRTLRPLWLTGAGLLAVVVFKLLFVDMSKAQGWERIVTFIGVGVLMLVIGYFVPLPPRKALQEKPA
jgi:uncharacterized membrane protein